MLTLYFGKTSDYKLLIFQSNYTFHFIVTMAAAANPSGGNVEEEFWSCSLSGSNKEYVWEPPATVEGVDDEGHRLHIETAFLSPTAKRCSR